MKNYEIIDYEKDIPFRIMNINKETNIDDLGNGKDVLEHWHREIEIVYTFAGNAKHYIDGNIYVSEPEKIYIINSQSIHKVISDNTIFDEFDKAAVVININYDFLRSIIPNIDEMYFLNENKVNLKEVKYIMIEFSRYAEGNQVYDKFEELKLIGLMYQLLYYLCKDFLIYKDNITRIKNKKSIERLRNIISYINMNYKDNIKQNEVAKKFYFTKEYFSRFFKKNTGLTFKKYLTIYRINMAKKQLLNTKDTILEIAIDNGFSDSKIFIRAFKEIYGITPLKYRNLNKKI